MSPVVGSTVGYAVVLTISLEICDTMQHLQQCVSMLWDKWSASYSNLSSK